MSNKNLEKTRNNKEKYIAKIISKRNAYRLIEQGENKNRYEIYGIPIIVETVKENTIYIINEKTKNEITHYLEKTYGIKNVLVFNNILKCSNFFNKQNLIEQKAKEYFEKEIYKDNEIEKCEKDINEMVIPIAIRTTCDNIVFDLNQYFLEKEFIFDNEFFKIEKMIKDCIKDKCFVKASLNATKYLIECVDGFYDKLLNENLLNNIKTKYSSKAAKIKIRNYI